MRKIDRYYLLNKYNQLRCFLIRRKQNRNIGTLDSGYLTIFHDYEGKYALPHVGDISLKGVNNILDTEKEYGVRVTYNIVGKLMEDCPEIVGRIIADGHELASHSFNHQIMADLSKNEVNADLEKTKEIFDTFGVTLKGFRSPQGKWTLKQMYSMFEHGLSWSAENENTKFPYILINRNKQLLVRLPIAMDDWEYIKSNIQPELMLQSMLERVERIAEEKVYGAIGFHPWIQGADPRRLIIYKRFMEIISRHKGLKIVTFGEMHDRYMEMQDDKS